MTGWESAWRYAFGLPDGVPQAVVAALGLAFAYLFVILPSGAVMAYLDRKLGADFQARVGPSRAGAAGIFQPLADVLKLVQKDAAVATDRRETLWWVVHSMALYSSVAVLPLGSLSLLVDTDMSALLPFWSALVLALGTLWIGLGRGTVPGAFGGARVAAQALAGAFPALVALLCAGVHAGGFSWARLAGVQSASPFHWTAAADPFQALAFVIFVVSGLVLFGIPPMDGALLSPDLRGGVASELFGRRFTLFRLGRFYGFFLWSVIAVVLFLGAWRLPAGLGDALTEARAWRSLQLAELVWLLCKTFALMLSVVWVARVNPRARVDQVTDFSWKMLSPFALVALIGAAVFACWRALP
jgi:NADH-quinone oxidoreductase subunit H